MRRSGKVASVPVGDALLGRVVDPLGNPIDGGGPIETTETRPLEFKAPGVVARQPVKEPLQTGIKAIDSMTNVGRGQRELIIGDRQTGKTAIVVDTILNQKDTDVVCIYVAIGQKASTVSQVYELLRDRGAMEYTTIVSAAGAGGRSDQVDGAVRRLRDGRVLPLQRPATSSASTTTSRSTPTRTGSCRCSCVARPVARLSPATSSTCTRASSSARASSRTKLGGGSLTALPIIETQAGDVSAYIPTNVISITDGQIFLESDLFFSGVRPAVNVGISVSRVGSSAQTKAMKKVAGRLRLDLSQYRELEAFAQFGSELDEATQKALGRGERMVATLNQPQYQPWPMEEQVVALYAGVNGFLDEIPVGQVPRFQEELREHLRAEGSILAEIRDSGDLSDDVAKRLEAEIEKLQQSFDVKEEASLVS